jgi:hypothetical protein
MPKKLAYNVRLRRQETGEDHARLIFAQDEATAKERAVPFSKHAPTVAGIKPNSSPQSNWSSPPS